MARRPGLIRRYVTLFVDFPSWMSLRDLSSNARALWGSFRLPLSRARVATSETFDALIQRLHLTEEDLKKRYDMVTRALLIYSFFGLFCACYCLYLLFSGAYFSAFMALLIFLLVVVVAVRQDVWRYQIEQRQLGMSLAHWYQSRKGKMNFKNTMLFLFSILKLMRVKQRLLTAVKRLIHWKPQNIRRKS